MFFGGMDGCRVLTCIGAFMNHAFSSFPIGPVSCLVDIWQEKKDSCLIYNFHVFHFSYESSSGARFRQSGTNPLLLPLPKVQGTFAPKMKACFW